MVALLLTLLSSAGLLIATYFTAVAYRWVRPDVGWVPAFCRMDEQTCATIVFTPQARLIGLPNSVLGQVFYVMMLLGVQLEWLSGPDTLRMAYLAASAASVGIGVYLSYALVFTLRVPCPLCFTSHGINLVIFSILAFG